MCLLCDNSASFLSYSVGLFWEPSCCSSVRGWPTSPACFWWTQQATPKDGPTQDLVSLNSCHCRVNVEFAVATKAVVNEQADWVSNRKWSSIYRKAYAYDHFPTRPSVHMLFTLTSLPSLQPSMLTGNQEKLWWSWGKSYYLFRTHQALFKVFITAWSSIENDHRHLQVVLFPKQ